LASEYWRFLGCGCCGLGGTVVAGQHNFWKFNVESKPNRSNSGERPKTSLLTLRTFTATTLFWPFTTRANYFHHTKIGTHHLSICGP
jgi:hypothetical protein